MSRYPKLTIVAATLVFAVASYSKAPASTPPGSTAACKDGSYSTAASKSGACSGHGGVKKWYGAAAEASAAPEAAPAAKSTKSKAEKSEKAEKAEKAPAPAVKTSKSDKGDKSETHAPAVSSQQAAATGQCKDGSYSTAASKSGACSGHGGVKDWYAGAAAPALAPAAAAAPMTRSAPAAASAPAPAPRATAAATAPAMPAAGGGKGQVWVNKESKVYHCPSDKWYGKTKDGAYMSESSAVAQGFHADHGKACQ